MIGAALVPLWFVGPLAAGTLLVVVWHLHMLREQEMPESRRRIRSATGGVMIVAIPMIAYTFGVVSTEDARSFVIGWTGVSGLIFLIVLLACVDVLNTARIARSHGRELAKERRALEHALGVAQRRAGVSGFDERE